MAQQPLVSVVTPVYNGRPYLGECIDSVRAQTYARWEHLIVDNCSTDGSLEIALEYARTDDRIHVFRNAEHVDASENHNIAFRKMDPEARYCKVVHADDLLLPECLSRMVEVGETYPSVGIVSSYSLLGTRIRGDGLPYPTPIMSGRAVCRQALLGELHVLFGPTTLLFRADVIRRRPSFFSEPSLHADTDVCFTVLADSDLGFVHQVLSYCRVHAASRSATTAAWLNAYEPAGIDMLQKHGPTFLSPEEYTRALATSLENYYRFLGKSLYRRREKRFWDFHRRELERLGHPLNVPRLIGTAIGAAGSVFLHGLRARRRALAVSRSSVK